MEKKKIIIISIAVVLLLVIIWYFWPVYFLKNVDEQEVFQIEVFDGANGRKTVIEDREQIKYIVENIQSVKMIRTKSSIGYKGFSFNMTFIAEDGEVLDQFTMNSSTLICDRPFFYESYKDGLCFEYIENIVRPGR